MVLCPIRQLLRLHGAEYIPSFKAGGFPGIEINAKASRATAVRVCTGTAPAELQLMGRHAVFPSQHFLFDDHNLALQIVLAGQGRTVFDGDGVIGDTLKAGLE